MSKLVLSGNYALSPPFVCNVEVIVVLITEGRKYNAEQKGRRVVIM